MEADVINPSSSSSSLLFPPQFDARDAKQRELGNECLKQTGLCIFTNVINHVDNKIADGHLWTFLERIVTNKEKKRVDFAYSTVSGGSKKTWTDEHWPGDLKTGVIDTNGAAQCEATWFCRTRPLIRSVFEVILDYKNVKEVTTVTAEVKTSIKPGIHVSLDAPILFRGRLGEEVKQGKTPSMSEPVLQTPSCHTSEYHGALHLVKSDVYNGGVHIICPDGARRLVCAPRASLLVWSKKLPFCYGPGLQIMPKILQQDEMSHYLALCIFPIHMTLAPVFGSPMHRPLLAKRVHCLNSARREHKKELELENQEKLKRRCTFFSSLRERRATLLLPQGKKRKKRRKLPKFICPETLQDLGRAEIDLFIGRVQKST